MLRERPSLPGKSERCRGMRADVAGAVSQACGFFTVKARGDALSIGRSAALARPLLHGRF